MEEEQLSTDEDWKEVDYEELSTDEDGRKDAY